MLLTQRRRSLSYRSQPPSPLQSPHIRLLLAWIEASLHHETQHDPRGVMAQFESALLEEMDRASGRLSIDRIVRDLVPESLKPLFALPPPQGLHQLLGCWTEAHNWKPGLAGLTEREAEAFDISLRPIWDEEQDGWRRRTTIEVGKSMKPSSRTGIALPPDAVDVLLSRSRRKVRHLFGLNGSTKED